MKLVDSRKDYGDLSREDKKKYVGLGTKLRKERKARKKKAKKRVAKKAAKKTVAKKASKKKVSKPKAAPKTSAVSRKPAAPAKKASAGLSMSLMFVTGISPTLSNPRTAPFTNLSRVSAPMRRVVQRCRANAVSKLRMCPPS